MKQITPSLATSLTNFPQLETVSEPEYKLPPIKVNGVAKISAAAQDFGVSVKINDTVIRLRYPPSIWQRFPKMHRKILAQNIAFGLTFHLPYLFTTVKRMFYNIPVPLSESFFF